MSSGAQICFSRITDTSQPLTRLNHLPSRSASLLTVHHPSLADRQHITFRLLFIVRLSFVWLACRPKVTAQSIHATTLGELLRCAAKLAPG